MHKVRRTLGRLRKYGLVTERLYNFNDFVCKLEYMFSNSVNHRVRFLRK